MTQPLNDLVDDEDLVKHLFAVFDAPRTPLERARGMRWVISTATHDQLWEMDVRRRYEQRRRDVFVFDPPPERRPIEEVRLLGLPVRLGEATRPRLEMLE